MKKHFTLIPGTISKDTVEALQSLLRDAESGDIIGFVYAAMYKGRNFIVNTAGEAYQSPTFARGMVAALDDHLMDRVRNE